MAYQSIEEFRQTVAAFQQHPAAGRVFSALLTMPLAGDRLDLRYGYCIQRIFHSGPCTLYRKEFLAEAQVGVEVGVASYTGSGVEEVLIHTGAQVNQWSDGARYSISADEAGVTVGVVGITLCDYDSVPKESTLRTVSVYKSVAVGEFIRLRPDNGIDYVIHNVFTSGGTASLFFGCPEQLQEIQLDAGPVLALTGVTLRAGMNQDDYAGRYYIRNTHATEAMHVFLDGVETCREEPYIKGYNYDYSMLTGNYLSSRYAFLKNLDYEPYVSPTVGAGMMVMTPRGPRYTSPKGLNYLQLEILPYFRSDYGSTDTVFETLWVPGSFSGLVELLGLDLVTVIDSATPIADSLTVSTAVLPSGNIALECEAIFTTFPLLSAVGAIRIHTPGDWAFDDIFYYCYDPND
jgi:hypothetical protein